MGKELMFVDTKVNGRNTKALVDTRTTNNFIAEEEAKRLDMTWEKCERLKSMNSMA